MDRMPHRHNDGEQSQASSSHSAHPRFLRFLGLSQEGQSLNQPANHDENSNLYKMTKDERMQEKQKIRKQEEIANKNIEINYEELYKAKKVLRSVQTNVNIARRELENAIKAFEHGVDETKLAKKVKYENANKELNRHKKIVKALELQKEELYKYKKECKNKQLSLQFSGVFDNLMEEKVLNDDQMLIAWDVLARLRGEQNTRYEDRQNTEEYKKIHELVNNTFEEWKKQNKM